MQVQHSSRNDNWATPKYIIKKVKSVLGSIELDPASNKHANDLIVKADKYYTKEDDSLSMDVWCEIPCTIYLNPPGGKKGNRSISALFWTKLMDHWEQGLVEHAIFMGFSLEQLAVTQGYHKYSIGDFTSCIPKRRIAFVDPLGEGRSQPSHSNVITYIPGNVNRVSLFKEVFHDLGIFITGA